MKRFLRDNSGATAIEYALIAALIVLIMLVGLIAVGQNNSKSYNNTAKQVGDALK